MDFVVVDKLDNGLRKHFWLRMTFLAVLAIAAGLAAGSLLRALV